MLTNAEKLRKELLAAISIGDFQKVKECIEEAENKYVKNEILNSREYSVNPIRLAVQKRNLKILRFLTARGGDVNAVISTLYFSTPLHIAAADNELKMVQFLLDSGANINATNYKSFTPLYLASFYCHPNMVRLLLSNNANVSIKDINGKTPLDVVGGYRRDMCNSNARQEIASMLKCAAEVICIVTIKTTLEADNNSSDYNTTDIASKKVEILVDELFAAIRIGNLQKVKKCIKEAESIGMKSKILSNERYSMKPIHFATDKCDLKILQLLLSEGADINATSSEYLNTSLHIAAISGELKIAQFLLDSGADIDAANYKGLTPLCLASFHCQSDMVELLFCNNANTNIKDMNNKTALDIVGGYSKDMCNSNSEMQRVISILNGTVSIDCKAILAFTRASLKVALEAGSVTSGAVRSSSFINGMLSWIGASTNTAALNQNAPALPYVQQPVAEVYPQVDHFNGIALLTAVTISKFRGKQYLKPLGDSPLTIEKTRERELNTIEVNVKTAISRLEKLYQCPGSSLSNSTISQSMHQNFL